MSSRSHTSRVSSRSQLPPQMLVISLQQIRIEALIGLRQLDTAQRAIDELLMRAREARRTGHEAMGLRLAADIEDARNERQSALARIEQATALAETAGLTRLLVELYSRATEIHRKGGDLER